MNLTFLIPEISYGFQGASNVIQIHPAVFSAVLAIITAVIGFLAGRLSSLGKEKQDLETKLTTAIVQLDGIVSSCRERHSRIDAEMTRIKDELKIS